MFNVITPMNRPENLNKMADMLEPKNITWHIVTDLDSPHNFKIDKSWVQHYALQNIEGGEFWERCNNAMNCLLDTITIHNNEWYCFLNDDDAVEPEYFNKVKNIINTHEINGHNASVVLTSMKRGLQIPKNVCRARRHQPTTLMAMKGNVKVGSIGLEQIVIKGSLLNKHLYRFPLTQNGDGEFIVHVVSRHESILCPQAFIWFNYFEPGRW